MVLLKVLIEKLLMEKLQTNIEYLSAIEEGKIYYCSSQFNILNEEVVILVEELVSCRKSLNFILSKPESVEYVDVSPKQLVSVAASLIPFLENDDANRALMGSNMMRQAVPLIKPESPLVGTGIEQDVAIRFWRNNYCKKRWGS